MKLIDRFFFICFILNVLLVIASILSFPLALFLLFKNIAFAPLKPGSSLMVLNLVLGIGSMMNWFYCLWFWRKFDRYSRSGLLLFFLQMLYAPVYYYQVKIQKRPLHGKIEQPENTCLFGQKEDLNETEMVQSTRDNILDILQAFQSDLDNSDAIIEQLSCWDDFVQPNDQYFKTAFEPYEQAVLKNFGDQLNVLRMKFLQADLSDISMWQEVQQLATLTLKKLGNRSL